MYPVYEMWIDALLDARSEHNRGDSGCFGNGGVEDCDVCDEITEQNRRQREAAATQPK